MYLLKYGTNIKIYFCDIVIVACSAFYFEENIFLYIVYNNITIISF